MLQARVSAQQSIRFSTKESGRHDPDAMADVNAVGDVVLTDPRAMLALADSSRLALHDTLRRRGPATVSELALLLNSSPGLIREHLEALEDARLVEQREPDLDTEQRKWAAIGKGVVFEIPEDAEGQIAARQLSNAMFLQYVDLPRSWVAEDEPQLALEWARAAGLLNVRLVVTPDELRDIQEALERVLEPLLTRQSSSVPAEASHVRILSYFMPEPVSRSSRDSARGLT
jgi:DNA-binding transcriptional ArsR family regulator